jgi:hypothetical protein
VKTLAWILTAAAVLVGADVFVMSSTPATTETLSTSVDTTNDQPIPLAGTSGIPTPPPDAY